MPGHKGVVGNEEADRLAKEAILLEKIEKLKIVEPKIDVDKTKDDDSRDIDEDVSIPQNPKTPYERQKND